MVEFSFSGLEVSLCRNGTNGGQLFATLVETSARLVPEIRCAPAQCV